MWRSKGDIREPGQREPVEIAEVDARSVVHQWSHWRSSHTCLSSAVPRMALSGALEEVAGVKKSSQDSCLQEVVSLLRKARVCELNIIICYLVRKG